MASVVLGFRREDVAHPLDGFGMLDSATGGIPNSRFDFFLLFISKSRARRTRHADQLRRWDTLAGAGAESAEELCQIVYEDLRVLLGITGKPIFKHHVLYPQAIPQYELSSLDSSEI